MTVRISTLLFCGLALCLCGLFYVSLPPTHQNSNGSSAHTCDCKPKTIFKGIPGNVKASHKARLDESQEEHNLAVLVPFRDRFEELIEFVPSFSQFLISQNKRHHIFVINQADGLRFNRAALLNAGFLETPEQYDHIALHDVDLLPQNPLLEYVFPSEGPYHVAAPYLHPRYHYPTFIGGVLLIRREHYEKANGMSNKYWGWGLEDDEFYARLKELNLEVFRPANLSTGTRNTFRHIHDLRTRRRDMIKCHNQQEITRRRDRHTGLSTSSYKVLNRVHFSVEGFGVTLLNVALTCDLKTTPWCNCTQNVGNTRRVAKAGGGDRAGDAYDPSDVIVPRLNRKKHLTPGG